MRQSRTLTLVGLAGAALLSGICPGTGQSYVPPPQLASNVDYTLPNYANSPALRKFVDKLPGLTAGGQPVSGFYSGANALGQHIPVAVKDTTKYPGADYYEIALVDYTEQMHSDLGPTKLRGYVQIETPGAAAVPTGSLHVLLPGVTFNGAQVYAYDNPSYLGPVIVSVKNTATRIKFYNLLPTTAQGGSLFLPTDTTVMGAGMGPDGMSSYSQNRATLHLHGGDNPWISDGTAHQWITPPGEATTYTNGVSQQNVPDMGAVPSQGVATFYWPNGQSGRLMFYHDHAFGMTRLDVYAGEAAGYLLVDPAERSLNTTLAQSIGAAAITEVPLVVQDKTFVWGTPTNTITLAPATGTYATDPLWASNSIWGQTQGSLWFPHVYMPNQNPNDLSGANPMGRWDYGAWFWPVFPSGIPPTTSIVPEAFMDTPVINGTAYPYLEAQPTTYRLRILNACNDRYLNLQLYVADPTVTSTDGRANTEVRMIPAVKNNGIAAGALDGSAVPWPAAWTMNDTAGMTPNVLDGRQGGVPDPSPSLQGPQFIHIGSEGGMSPNAVPMVNTPIGYEQNKRSVTVLNTYEHTLFLGPAERADVLVDLSQYPGKTLILYNDAPAPLPAGDPRYDYYTGNPDLTSSGGAASTQIGYGPNTRTIMQIRVGTGTPTQPLATTTVDAAVAAAFAATQPAPIVPLGSSPGTNVARISDTSMTVNGVTMPLLPKTIQELFDPLGRMNATLGVEIPFTTATIQTTIPYGFADPATEVIPDGATQLWKITHNGVDTHAIHFHLFNVQVVNRVGWDGAIKLPWPEELGWKETVKMNPLEDIIVALKAKTPSVPFNQPDNVRYLDPSMPPGSTAPFLGVGPDGNPVTVSNVLANFGDEYTWHCHLLGHEENDMMRPIMVATPPNAPSGLKATVKGSGLALAWVNNATLAASNTVVRASNGSFTAGLVTNVVAGTATSFTDTSYKANGVPYYYAVYATSVVGSGVPGFPSISVNSPLSNIVGPPAGTITAKVSQAAATRSPVVVSWSYSPAGDQTSFTVQRATNSGFTSGLTTFNVNSATATSYSDTSTKAGTTYYYRVRANNALGSGAWFGTTPLSITPHA